MEEVLATLGLNEKAVQVYLASLKLGPSPVRAIALEAGTNRGTTYDLLKELIAEGLVSYFHKEKRQYFIAEDPQKLTALVARRRQKLDDTAEALDAVIPQLNHYTITRQQNR